MRKFGRNKIALLLLLLRFSGGKTSAMELNKVKTQNLQTLEAVGGGRLLKIQIEDLSIGLKIINVN